MKNNLFYNHILIIFFCFTFINLVQAQEQFSFDVTEIEITNNGNLYKGLKRGIINSNDGIIIEADKFIYNKETNILDAEGKVKLRMLLIIM